MPLCVTYLLPGKVGKPKRWVLIRWIHLKEMMWNELWFKAQVNSIDLLCSSLLPALGSGLAEGCWDYWDPAEVRVAPADRWEGARTWPARPGWGAAAVAPGGQRDLLTEGWNSPSEGSATNRAAAEQVVVKGMTPEREAHTGEFRHLRDGVSDHQIVQSPTWACPRAARVNPLSLRIWTHKCLF